MSMLPPPPESKPIFVAVLDLLGFKRKLLDVSDVPIPGGLEEIYTTYYLFLYASDWSTKVDNIEPGSDENLRHVFGRIGYFVASDTVLLWANDDEASYFVGVVAKLVKTLLEFRVPLRGAISYGNCIIEKDKNIYLGLPIVKAIEAEKVQEWIGVAVLPSAAERLNNHPYVVEYSVPVKSNSSILLKHALAWPLADDTPNEPTIRLGDLKNMAPDKDKVKYENALAFVNALVYD